MSDDASAEDHHEVELPSDVGDDARPSRESSPKPTAPQLSGAAGSDAMDAIVPYAQIEARLIRVLRKEVQDPYGGLPADDVLARLNREFPALNIPGRMLDRLEKEQAERHEHSRRQDELDRYVAESARAESAQDHDLQRSWGGRAERVFFALVAAGLVLVFTGHESTGAIVLGTTLVGVVGAFVAQSINKHRSSDG